MSTSSDISQKPDFSATLGVRMPAQERGRVALDRILEAASELLAERGYDSLTLAAVAQRAGVSYGAMQYRVATKDALIGAVHEQFWAQVETHSGTFLDEGRWSGLTLGEVLDGAVRELGHVYTFNPALLRGLALRAGTDEALLEKVSEVVHRGSRSFVALVGPRLAEAGHTDADDRARAIYTAVTGAMSARVVWPTFHDGSIDWNTFVERLCEMAKGIADAPPAN